MDCSLADKPVLVSSTCGVCVTEQVLGLLLLPSFYTPHPVWTTKPNPRSRKREALSLGPLTEQLTQTPLFSSREGGMIGKGPQPKLSEPQLSSELSLKMCLVIVLVLFLFCPCVEARFLSWKSAKSQYSVGFMQAERSRENEFEEAR